MALIILPIITIATSIISAVTGMGGGILLLSLMTFFVPYQVIVPIHGIVQFISNGSRAFMLAKNVRWDFVLYFVLGAPFGFVAAFYILKTIQNHELYYLLLALFILYVIFKPKSFPEIKLSGFQWTILGFFGAIQGAILGATGPLLAIFYVRSDLSKEEVVSTKAMQQLFTHLFKIPLFLTLEFDYFKHFTLISSMSVAAFIGTALGVRILSKVDEGLFRKIYKTILFIASMRLLYKFGISL